jgi:hypothetical protein
MSADLPKSEPQDPPLKMALRTILATFPGYTDASLIVAMRPTPPDVTLRLLAEIREEEEAEALVEHVAVLIAERFGGLDEDDDGRIVGWQNEITHARELDWARALVAEVVGFSTSRVGGGGDV